MDKDREDNKVLQGVFMELKREAIRSGGVVSSARFAEIVPQNMVNWVKARMLDDIYWNWHKDGYYYYGNAEE